MAPLGFEDLTAVVMKSSVFWDIMLCSPMKVTCFSETFLLGYNAI
jgi:hypothetical protein